MQILKPFIDGQGRRFGVGDEVPADLDKTAVAHYLANGMIGEPAGAADAKKPGRKPRAAAPAETKPAAPAEAAGDAPSVPADGSCQDAQQETEQAQGAEPV